MGDITDWLFDQVELREMKAEAEKAELLMLIQEELKILSKYKNAPISVLRKALKWTTRDGRQILLMEMADQHIFNTIRWLGKNSAGERGIKLRFCNDWIYVLKREQEYRRTHKYNITFE